MQLPAICSVRFFAGVLKKSVLLDTHILPVGRGVLSCKLIGVIIAGTVSTAAGIVCVVVNVLKPRLCERICPLRDCLEAVYTILIIVCIWFFGNPISNQFSVDIVIPIRTIAIQIIAECQKHAPD